MTEKEHCLPTLSHGNMFVVEVELFVGSSSNISKIMRVNVKVSVDSKDSKGCTLSRP